MVDVIQAKAQWATAIQMFWLLTAVSEGLAGEHPTSVQLGVQRVESALRKIGRTPEPCRLPGTLTCDGLAFRLHVSDGQWCCYTWTLEKSAGERLVFAVDRSGRIVGSRESSYLGLDTSPSFDAAYVRDVGNDESRRLAVGMQSNDGCLWLAAEDLIEELEAHFRTLEERAPGDEDVGITDDGE